MMPKKFGTHTQAVAGVIEALLMVALVTIVISVVQLYYIPQVMEQREAEHMDQVFNQFSSMKSMIDMQTITHSTSPISSMITLGSPNLPYFVTAGATGELRTYEASSSNIELNPALPIGSIPLTSIQYLADNSYFVDQSYILEGGGIIVKQSDGTSVMRADPSISAVNNSNNITIRLEIPHVIAIPGKNYTAGDGKCFIRTNYSSSKTYTDSIPVGSGGSHIRIYSRYINAWNESLFRIIGIYDKNGCLHITQYGTEPTGYIEIQPGTKDIFLQLNVIDIQVQIGPGWIK
jgi:hypothetical protein